MFQFSVLLNSFKILKLAIQDAEIIEAEASLSGVRVAAPGASWTNKSSE
jgi:hypothetical protein